MLFEVVGDYWVTFGKFWGSNIVSQCKFKFVIDCLKDYKFQISKKMKICLQSFVS